MSRNSNFMRQQFNESYDRYSVLYDEIFRSVTNEVSKINCNPRRKDSLSCIKQNLQTL